MLFWNTGISPLDVNPSIYYTNIVDSVSILSLGLLLIRMAIAKGRGGSIGWNTGYYKFN